MAQRGLGYRTLTGRKALEQRRLVLGPHRRDDLFLGQPGNCGWRSPPKMVVGGASPGSARPSSAYVMPASEWVVAGMDAEALLMPSGASAASLTCSHSSPAAVSAGVASTNQGARQTDGCQALSTCNLHTPSGSGFYNCP